MNPANRSTKSDIQSWLTPIIEKEGLKKFAIDISGNSKQGDGYLGDITFAKVNGTTEAGEERTYHFVVKCGKKSAEFRDALPVRSAFENEIMFYNEVLPTYIKFQKERGIKEPFDNTPKCYGTFITEDMEVLVLDNLRKKQYDLHNRQQPMNKEHIRTVLTTYGKLHAISFALRDQKPDVFKKLSGKLTDVFKIMPRVKRPEETNMYLNIIGLARKENEDEIVEKAFLLDRLARNVHDITDPTDPFSVILHGDCWNNNFMFKYEDEQKTNPSDVCLLDFQLTRLASPVYDLSYFLFTCLSEENVDDFDELIDLYYTSFSKFLRELGGDPNKMFPFEELLNQFKKFSLFGLIMMPGIVRICLSESDEVPDLVEAAESGTDIFEMFLKPVRNMEQYRKRTLPIMKLAVRKGFALE